MSVLVNQSRCPCALRWDCQTSGVHPMWSQVSDERPGEPVTLSMCTEMGLSDVGCSSDVEPSDERPGDPVTLTMCTEMGLSDVGCSSI